MYLFRFSPTCMLKNDGNAQCDNCPQGYGGQQCEK